MTEEKQKFTWKLSYTIVLLVNAFYIYLFYLLMQNFA